VTERSLPGFKVLPKFLSNTNAYVNLICITLVLQSSTDSLHILPGSSGESHVKSSDDACVVSNTEVEVDVDIKEEGSVAVNEEVAIGVKQAEILEDVNFIDINAEPDEVSCVCVCLLLDIFYQFPAMSVVFFLSVFLAT